MSQAPPALGHYPNRHSFYGWPKNTQPFAVPAGARALPNASQVSATSNGPTDWSTHRYSMVNPLPAAHAPIAKPVLAPNPKKAHRRMYGTVNSVVLLESEYQPLVLEHMHAMEKQTTASMELMSVQPELHWFMRPYLVDFMIEIHQSFRLRPETLYLTMNLVDRYVSKRIVYKRHYQLVGCAALLIAAKFEDSKDRVPTVQELSQMCCNAYDASAFSQMEGHVLSTLGWTLGHPTVEAWLRYELTSVPAANPHTQNIARFLGEVTLFHQDFIETPPSAVAAGAVIVARHICRDPRPRTPPVERVAVAAANQIFAFMVEHGNDLSQIMVKKYSYAYYSEASTVTLDWFRRRAVMNKSEDYSSMQYRQEAYSSDEEDNTMISNSPNHSLFSTPSRSITRDDDDDESLPVTPMSLNSLHGTGTTAPSSRTDTNGRSARPVFHGNNEMKHVSTTWQNLAHLKPIARYSPKSSMDVDVDMPTKV